LERKITFLPTFSSRFPNVKKAAADCFLPLLQTKSPLPDQLKGKCGEFFYITAEDHISTGRILKGRVRRDCITTAEENISTAGQVKGRVQKFFCHHSRPYFCKMGTVSKAPAVSIQSRRFSTNFQYFIKRLYIFFPFFYTIDLTISYT
jgi:hypothetical protein